MPSREFHGRPTFVEMGNFKRRSAESGGRPIGRLSSREVLARFPLKISVASWFVSRPKNGSLRKHRMHLQRARLTTVYTPRGSNTQHEHPNYRACLTQHSKLQELDAADEKYDGL